MDHTANSAATFHRLAEVYRDKFMDLTFYHDSFRDFCASLRPGPARVLDAACGPGNVSRFLLSQRPNLQVLGIDLAPRMVELAQQAVPSVRFAVHDCRRLRDLKQRFDGIVCAFGLPYLSRKDGREFVRVASQCLEPGGVLYLSTILGNYEDSGFATSSTGDRIYLYYHSEEDVSRWLHDCGFTVKARQRLPSPSSASLKSTDLVLIATK